MTNYTASKDYPLNLFLYPSPAPGTVARGYVYIKLSPSSDTVSYPEHLLVETGMGKDYYFQSDAFSPAYQTQLTKNSN